jgi:hypothetical protein
MNKGAGMAEIKTKPTPASVKDFLNNIPDENKRRDSFTVLEMMRQASGYEPVMWGPSIVGFGTYHYRYASGREGDMPIIGFSPRLQALTLYIMSGLDEYGELLARLGKHKTGKACLYIKRLSDVDRNVLQELIEKAVAHMGKIFP